MTNQPLIHDDLASLCRLESIQTILRVLCETTGLRLALIARVTEKSWTACAVMDNAGFGLEVGHNLELDNTY